MATVRVDEVIALAAVSLVYITSRSAFRWTDSLPGPQAFTRMVRRVLRSAVLLPAFFFLPLPSLTPPWWTVAAGLLIGLIAVSTQWKTLKRWMQPNYLRLYGPITRAERAREVFHFSVAGAAQEYLYRQAVLFAFRPVLGPGAIILATALFVGEHFIHPDAVWDRKDVSMHTALGLSLGAIAYAAGGFVPAVIGHTIYNAPNVALALKVPGPTATEGPASVELQSSGGSTNA